MYIFQCLKVLSIIIPHLNSLIIKKTYIIKLIVKHRNLGLINN